MRHRIIWLLVLSLSGCGNAATQAKPTAQPNAVAHGKLLFRDKGCATCHLHRKVGEDGLINGAGPELSTYHADPAFLRRWLADPQAVRPDANMPNLGLAPAEIDALIAFLNTSSP